MKELQRNGYCILNVTISYVSFVFNTGLDIHYIHVKPNIHSKGKKIFPLLMLHGWPSSIIEFYKIIPLLTCSKSEYNFIFEVIVPSLPGFGFSDAPMSHDDFSCIDMSVVLKNLMLRLGHNKFYVHGGDWGIFISRIMSTLFPEQYAFSKNSFLKINFLNIISIKFS